MKAKNRKKKRAVSDVIVIILLILVVIMAVFILWKFVLPLLGEKTDEIPPAEVFNENIKIDEGKTNFLTEPAKVTITRSSGEMDYNSIKIVFYNESGSYMHTIDKPDELPEPLETKTYYIYLLCEDKKWVEANGKCKDEHVKNYLVDATRFAVYITYKSAGGRERILPMPATFDELGVNCQAVSNRMNEILRRGGIFECIQYASGGIIRANQDDPYYDMAADVNDDKSINLADREIFMQNNGNEAWCLSQLTKQENLCSGYPCMTLFNKLVLSYGADCTQEEPYNPVGDLDNSNKTDLTDLAIFVADEGYEGYKDWTNEAWCSLHLLNEKLSEPMCISSRGVCLDKFCY